jgi:hypothetical protein
MSVDDQTQVVVQRLLANGTIDSTFGPFGTAKVSTGIKPGWGFDVAVVARSGEVLVSGQAPNPNHGNIVEAVIAKYSSTGLVVMSFGASGRMFGSACTPNGGNVSTTPYVFDKLSLQSTGAILAHAASSFGGFAVVSTVFKFSSAGVRDAGFGPNLPCGFVMESSLAFARNDNDAFIFGYKRYSASGIVDNTYNASISLNNSKFASVSPQDSKIVFTQSPFPDNGTLTMTRIMP